MNTNDAMQTLERRDYTENITSLAKKTSKLACKVLAKMRDLQIENMDVWTDNGYRTLTRFYVHASAGFEEAVLSWDETIYDLTLDVVGNGENGFYFAGDFNCEIKYPRRKDIIDFANNFQAIIDGLHDTETNFVQKIKKAEEKITKTN